jgi:ribosome-binding factor A
MAGSQRLKRMADSVQRELSELIRQELKDPRLGGYVTISAVKVSADMGYAEVYVTVMGRELGDEQSEAANKETLDVLNKASGFLRHELSVVLRHVLHHDCVSIMIKPMLMVTICLV